MNTYNSSTLLSKLLNYESMVYNTYTSKREKLLSFLEQIEINTLNNDQLLIFINDLKNIIDPVKTSIDNIDHIFSNVNFENKESIHYNLQFIRCMILSTLFQSPDETLVTEESETLESSESPESSLDDEKSSRSSSLIFSNT